MRNSSKVILVTGASSGFGRAMALSLKEQGHRVFGTSRKPAMAAEAGLEMLALDVTREESARACVDAVIEQAGRLDVLINNAGSGLTGAIEDCASDEARWQMDTNFFGPLLMTQLVLPQMRRRAGGRIITIGSLAGQAALPYQGLYSASKHALEAVNEALRMELAGSGVDATIVCPGDFKTGFTAARVFARDARSKVHAEQMQTTVAIYERDEMQGAPAQQVADLVSRLVAAKKLRVRYFVGRVDQTWGMLLKRWIPAAWFERIMQLIYKLPRA